MSTDSINSVGLKSGWMSFESGEIHKSDNFPSRPAEYDFSEFLPPKVELTLPQKSLLKEMAETGSTRNFAEWTTAVALAGQSSENHASTIETLTELQESLAVRGINLPSAFTEFCSNKEFVDRYRTNCVFEIFSTTCDFPGNPDLQMILFQHGGQGFDFWHLILGEDIEFVTYGSRGYCFPHELWEAEDDDTLIVVSTSFAEFIWKVCHERGGN